MSSTSNDMNDIRRLHIKELPFCAWCGKTDNLLNFSYLDGFTTFCGEDENSVCRKYYTNFFDSQHRDMSNGVPIVYSKLLPSHFKEAEEKSRLLTCDYCNVTNDQVITNTSFDRRLQFANFCKNNTCCRKYFRFRDTFDRIPACLCNNKNILLEFRQPTYPRY